MTDPFYAESGNKPDNLPLVLLHGFCETHRLWDQFRQALGEETWILCPDLPGFGRSTSLPAGFTLSEVAHRLAGWLEQLQISKCILIGHSLGGYVALAMLEHHPQLVAGIGLFHSTAYADSPQKRRSRNNVIDFVEKHGVEVFATSFVPQLFYHTNRKQLKEQIEVVVADAAATPEHTLISYTRAMQQRPNRLPVLEKWGGPTLYIIGEKDTSVSLEDSLQQLESLPQADAHILHDTGHMGMLEQEEQSIQIVKDFIQEVRQQKNS
ncbi:alpha/beta fold hydrolase [Cesiribacter sp. SM1]|uniref:alpha/beta fold hydrolase n=1 Tax=Cesiribacter sp. SM1 TaxID=2861196 RepID=UPI001CD6E1DD|nr:alpha/beta hydrolase [Cesiribacter sp. SM1]